MAHRYWVDRSRLWLVATRDDDEQLPSSNDIGSSSNGDTSDKLCAKRIRSVSRNSDEISGTLSIYNSSVKTLLGHDKKATAKAITAASKIDGYSYFGDVNCKVFKLEDYIERAPKDQRGKNGHYFVFVIVTITQYC